MGAGGVPAAGQWGGCGGASWHKGTHMVGDGWVLGLESGGLGSGREEAAAHTQ